MSPTFLGTAGDHGTDSLRQPPSQSSAGYIFAVAHSNGWNMCVDGQAQPAVRSETKGISTAKIHAINGEGIPH